MFDFRKLSLEKKVQYFIKQRKETEFWDFKQKQPDNIRDLIKDIVCFSNTTHDRDCYLIFGVSDDFQIVGIDNTKRLEMANIEDAFSKMIFANGVRPKIDLSSIIIEEKELQVLTIFNEPKTPIYLEKRYHNMSAGCIYTRHGDRNTPDNGNATPAEIEALWKKRFNLLKTSLDFVFENLNKEDEWIEIEGNYYNSHRPAYNIRIEKNQEEKLWPEFYHHIMINHKCSYRELTINYNEIKLDSYQLTWLDSGRLLIPVPEHGFVSEIYDNVQQSDYRYYLEGSFRHELMLFLYDPANMDQYDAMHRLQEVILFFHSEDEKRCFEHWVNIFSNEIRDRTENNKAQFYVDSDNQLQKNLYLHKLALGKTLNEYLKKFRKLENH